MTPDNGYDDPRNHHIVCECLSDEHTLRLIHFKAIPKHANTDDSIYWSVYLNPLPWRKRLWTAIRYVFGHRSRYGDWDSGPSMSQGEIQHLRDFLSDVTVNNSEACAEISADRIR